MTELVNDTSEPIVPPMPDEPRTAAPAAGMGRTVVTIGVLQFASMCLLLGRTKLVALALGPETLGTMSVVDKLAALISQSVSLSLPFAALRFLPAAMRESADARARLYRQMLSVLVALILLAAAGCVAISLAAPSLWGADLLASRWPVLIALCGLPVVALVPFLTNAFAGGLDPHRSMRFTIAHSAILFAGAVVAAAGFGLSGYYAAYALLGTALVAFAAWQLAPGDRPPLPWRDRFRLPAPVWRFSGALLALTIATPYAALYVQYTSLHLYGAAASGILQAAVGISLTVRTLLGTAHAVFLTPQVNRHADPAGRMDWANEFQRVTATLFVAFLPPLLLFADVALRLLYSGQFVGAAAFVALFVGAEVVTMLSGTYQSLIVAGDRMAFHVLQNLAAQALLVGVAAIALPRLGLAGAGLSALAAPLFLYASTRIFLRRSYGVRVSAEAGQMALLALAIVALCGFAGARWPGLDPALIAAKAVACLLIWGAAYLAMPAADRERLRTLVERGAGLVRLNRGAG